MAGSKRSRKGKKDWRKNIDTSEIDAQIEQANTDARRGPGVETLQDDELFVLDTEPSQQTLTKLAKRRKKETKPLRSQLVLDSIGQGIKAVNPAATKHKQKGQLLKKHQQAEEAAAGKAAAPAKSAKQQPALDVWDRPPPDAGKPDFLPEMRSTAYKASAHKHRAALVPAAPLIKAVEIDPAGCSFNPDREQHQDAVALLVASEMKKVLAQELAPVAPPAEADADYRRLSELEQLLVEAEADEEEEEEKEGGEEQPRKKRKQAAAAAAAAAGQQGEEQRAGDDSGSGSGADDEGSEEEGFGAAAGSKRHSAKKTKQDRNREAKRKALEAQLAAKKELKKQRRDVDALKNLQAELAAQQAEQELRRQRREAVAAEKAASQPPRLGKQKYEPEPVQVLTSDELTGSLRQLAPCFTVAKDRFKALQKRGLVEVRAPRSGKKGRRVAYEGGARQEKALEGQAEVEAMRRKRVAAERALRGKQQLG